ncbi:MAG: DUF6544 family protein [Acetivibrionales bacterium]|jgi:hypothetical protein
MKKRGRKIVFIIAMTILALIAALFIFFRLPGSRTKTEFSDVVNSKISNAEKNSDIFTENDIKDLPLPVKKYFRHCGYLGTPKMSYMKASFADVDFKMSESKTIKIDYIQYNFVERPERFAYIDSSIFGIPFEGLDSYQNGTGSMKGRLAKVINLFDQRGETMDKACLVTILAECFLYPNAVLQDYIKWEEIDDTHVKATITYYGISASGVFTFDENGEVLSFETNDRVATAMDGSSREIKWSAIYSDYRDVNGLKQPQVLQSIWHYPEGDSVYFNENKTGVTIEYYYTRKIRQTVQKLF